MISRLVLGWEMGMGLLVRGALLYACGGGEVGGFVYEIYHYLF